MSEATQRREGVVAVVGDVHGHLQLALAMLARWQRESALRFDAVFLCGDVGTFTHESQLDSATHNHARDNPCELEFLHQWSPCPPAPWLGHIFMPGDEGLSLACPVIMVHGNHEGFAHLEPLARRRMPLDPLEISQLPTVDAAGWIRYLPSGGRVRLPSGHVAAGVGGIEAGQRRAKYHPLAYIEQHAVDTLVAGGPADILITHQGPQFVQGSIGSSTLDALLEAATAKVWFHGHGMQDPAITVVGRTDQTTVVPLGDVAFSNRGQPAGDPGLDGWAYVRLGDAGPSIIRQPPPFWRDYRRSKWIPVLGWGLVCPDLTPFIPPDAACGR